MGWKTHIKGNKKSKVIIIACVIAVVVCIMIFLPVQLHVNIGNSAIYEGEDLSENDITVEESSLLGIKHTLIDYNKSYDNKTGNLTVSYKWMKRHILFDIIHVRNIDVKYNKPAYEGDIFDVKNVTENVTFDNSTVKEAKNLEADFQGTFTSDIDVKITSAYGSKILSINPYKIENVSVEYEASPRYGDDFQKNLLKVYVNYSDSTNREITDYELNAPSVFTKNTTIVADTKYGTGVYTIKPYQVTELTAEYDQKLYEGDSYDPEHVILHVSFDDGYSTNLKISGGKAEKITKDKTIILKTKFGEVELSLKPVKVTEITSPDSVDGLTEGDSLNIKTLELTYSDGTKKDLDVSKYKITPALDDPVKAGLNKYSFTYHNTTYQFMVYAASKAASNAEASNTASDSESTS